METDRVIELLEELVAWQRFAHRDALARLWGQILADPRHLIGYELSDGTRTQKQVGEMSGLSQPTISGLWTKWRRMGLLRESRGQLMHIARPSDLGIPVPRAIGGPMTSGTEAIPGAATEVEGDRR